MHIPQAGDKKFACSVYYLCIRRQSYFFCLAKLGYAITGYHYRHIRLGRRSGNINDRDVSDDERTRPGCLLRLREQQSY